MSVGAESLKKRNYKTDKQQGKIMETIRSFVAIELPADLKKQIDQYQRQLKPLCRHTRWVNSKGLHITLKFLGEQEPDLIDRVQQNLFHVQGAVKPFRLTVKNFGAFPGKRSPRVLWLGVVSQPLEAVHDLFQFIEENLHGLGFVKEKRRFSPHLTLARVKQPGRFDPLWEYVQKHPFEPYTFEVNKIVLMRSILKPQGAEYRPIATYSLR
ncbi:2'-5' RNA ligase [Caldithrix abyssi DSM 13497]|uniref:RNA 2',3'-cyclic phosphodiesterase n=2 Tax=Caldithrix abyssi TaxID=187145 RepID=H1XX79_CALAY|nr:RNA 2',3'-cyclic phosphodiesterase [Caldithrix abyssi]APF20683.1 2'-5' RNA ligase [Caldithrix abyssi DSM 13497]EHO40816.1 2'-5' RNA ligase [Caldithrix abyssi DSM 13497]